MDAKLKGTGEYCNLIIKPSDF